MTDNAHSENLWYGNNNTSKGGFDYVKQTTSSAYKRLGI